MNGSVIVLLATSLLIIVSGFAWVMLRHYSQRLSRVDEELQAIKVMLSEMPKEDSIKDYMFAQDQLLREIVEKLGTHTETDVLQQYIQDQANQIIATISTHDESRKSGITRADLETSLQRTNELLERVLWSLRFDEDKYAENTEIIADRPGKQGKTDSGMDAQGTKAGNDGDDNVSIQSILDDSDDSYSAMLHYMEKSGKSGVEALHALKTARLMRNR